MTLRDVFTIYAIIQFYAFMILISYYFISYIKPYDPDEDYDGIGDTNKLLAFIWPISVSILCVGYILFFIYKLFDYYFNKINSKNLERVKSNKEKEKFE